MTFEDQIRQYQVILSGNGKKALKDSIRAFRERYGQNWKQEFLTDYPELAEILSLCANFTPESAFERLKQIADQKIDQNIHSIFQRGIAKVAVNSYLDTAKPEILKLHEEIQAEIHKPRFSFTKGRIFIVWTDNNNQIF